MTNVKKSYVEKVRLENQRFLDELQRENELVREVALALQTENNRLRDLVERQMQDITRFQSERDLYRLHLSTAETETRRFSDEFAEVEQRNLNLANLYVASYQLHGTLSRDAVLTAVKEIVVNLVGSEEFAVYELVPGSEHLEMVTGIGVDESRFGTVPLSTSAIGRCALSGETVVNPSREDAEVAGLVACIPLKLDQRVTGAIAIFRLLPHKSRLEDIDYELFDLLASHAATALYCTALHAGFAVATASAAGVDERRP